MSIKISKCSLQQETKQVSHENQLIPQGRPRPQPQVLGICSVACQSFKLLTFWHSRPILFYKCLQAFTPKSKSYQPFPVNCECHCCLLVSHLNVAGLLGQFVERCPANKYAQTLGKSFNQNSFIMIQNLGSVKAKFLLFFSRPTIYI